MKIDSISSSTYTSNAANSGRTANVKSVSGKDIGKGGHLSSQTGLTIAEQAYFAKLFPGAATQSNSQKTYSPSGVSQLVELGQIVNRKG